MSHTFKIQQTIYGSTVCMCSNEVIVAVEINNDEVELLK